MSRIDTVYLNFDLTSWQSLAEVTKQSPDAFKINNSYFVHFFFNFLKFRTIQEWNNFIFFLLVSG